MENCIRKYSEIDIEDIGEVGYKNATIGEMKRLLAPHGILIPDGFAITAEAYQYFVRYNNLESPLRFLIDGLDTESFSNLSSVSSQARKLIMDCKMPPALGMGIIDAYDYLFDVTQAEVAIRSSAVDNQATNINGIGLNDSFLNVHGHGALFYAIKQCFASLYNDRAVKHAAEWGYQLHDRAMAVGVQQMIRADKGASGVTHTIDPRDNTADEICIKAMWGLGEMINHETIEPDEYLVLKASLKTGTPVIEKELGGKHKMMIYADEDNDTDLTVLTDTPLSLQQRFVLDEKEILHLAEWAALLETVYKKPMGFEWAKDGNNHQLYLLQTDAELVNVPSCCLVAAK